MARVQVIKVPQVAAVPSAGITGQEWSVVNLGMSRLNARQLDAASYPGVDPTGAADSGEGLQLFFNDLSAFRIPGVIPPGTYRVGRILDVGSNTTLSMHGATLLQDNLHLGGPAPGQGQSLLRIANGKNIVIAGGTLDGRKSAMTGASEFKHGIEIRGDCDTITIRDVTATANRGDGFFVGRWTEAAPYKVPRNLTFERVTATANHRQGMSITHGRDIAVNDSVFADTAGTAPECGLDIEPNNANETIRDIFFTRCSFTGNRAAGVNIYDTYGTNNGNYVFTACTFRENARGVALSAGHGAAFVDASIRDNTAEGVRCADNSFRNATFRGGEVERNGTHGVMIQPPAGATVVGVTLDGVTVRRNNTVGGANDNVVLGSTTGGPVTDVLVTRCTLGDPVAAETARYSFLTGPSASRMTIADNTLRPGTTATALLQDEAATRFMRDNQGYRTRRGGTVSVANAGEFLHGLAATPTTYSVQATVAGHYAQVASVTSTTMTIRLREIATDVGVDTPEPVIWTAEV